MLFEEGDAIILNPFPPNEPNVSIYAVHMELYTPWYAENVPSSPRLLSSNAGSSIDLSRFHHLHALDQQRIANENPDY